MQCTHLWFRETQHGGALCCGTTFLPHASAYCCSLSCANAGISLKTNEGSVFYFNSLKVPPYTGLKHSKPRSVMRFSPQTGMRICPEVLDLIFAWRCRNSGHVNTLGKFLKTRIRIRVLTVAEIKDGAEALIPLMTWTVFDVQTQHLLVSELPVSAGLLMPWQLA